MHFLHPLLLAPVALARPWAMPQEVTKPPPAMGGGEEKAAPPEEPAMTGRVIPVVVGGQQDVFVPNVVKASVGDVVQFQFSAGNHTVTQSSADAACVPLQMTDPAGVHSGHIPFEAGQGKVGVFEMPVVSTDTMFMYCATGPHCQLGQIMVINPTDDQQVVDYAKLAQAAPENIDGTEVVGGTVSEIPLEQAAFDPPPPEEGEAPPPPGDAPPAEGETPAKGEAPPTGLPPAEKPTASEMPAASEKPAAPEKPAASEKPAAPEKPPAKNPGIVIVPLPSSTDAPAATETVATETTATETAATETSATETAATETVATETAAAGEPAITTVFVTVTAAAATATA